MPRSRRGSGIAPLPSPEGEGGLQFVDQWRRERPDLDFEWMQVAVCIHEIEQSFRGDLAKAVIPRIGGGLADFDVVSHLRSAGPPYAMRPTDLFRALSVTSGAVTGRIDRLVGLGWVTRDPSDDDRRVSMVRLTREGLAVSDWLADYGARASVIARALQAMPAARRRQLIAVLEQFYGAVRADPDA